MGKKSVCVPLLVNCAEDVHHVEKELWIWGWHGMAWL